MPVYEYWCEKCKEKFERLVKIDDEVYCKYGGEVEKLVSTFCFKFGKCDNCERR